MMYPCNGPSAAVRKKDSMGWHGEELQDMLLSKKSVLQSHVFYLTPFPYK